MCAADTVKPRAGILSGAWFFSGADGGQKRECDDDIVMSCGTAAHARTDCALVRNSGMIGGGEARNMLALPIEGRPSYPMRTFHDLE